MCLFVFILVSFLVLSTTVSTYDEIVEYWDSNNDGFIDKLADEKYDSGNNGSRFEQINQEMYNGDAVELLSHGGVKKIARVSSDYTEFIKGMISRSKESDGSSDGDSNNESQTVGNYYDDDLDDTGEPDPEDKGYTSAEIEYYKGTQCMHGMRYTYGCFDCYCVGGQILICSSVRCPFINEKTNLAYKYKKPKRKKIHKSCKTGVPVPSPDGCNQCVCENRRVVCTTKTCGPIIPLEHRHCVSHSWHTLENPTCKECYCIDGETSFCYLNYCGKKFKKYKKALLKGEIHNLKGLRQPVLGVCEPDQYFTLGTDRTCQGCICTKHKKWKCWSIKGACASYSDSDCPPGDTMNNLLSPCSICYCGIDGTNMCTTDESCAHNIRILKSKTTFCDSLNCLSQCRDKSKTKKYIGICLKTGCTCAV